MVGFWGIAVGFRGVRLDTGFLRPSLADEGGGLLGARSPAGGRGSGRSLSNKMQEKHKSENYQSA